MKRFIFVASSILFLSTSLFSCSNKDSNVFYDFDIQVIGEGNVNGTKPGKYEFGTEITLTCSTIQNSNYEFDGFYKDDTLIFSGLTYTFTLVDDTDRYIQSLLDYLKVQEEKDTLSINVNDVVEYCQGIIDAKDNSPILQALNEKIDALNLDENQKNTYKQQLSTTFNDSFITAYQNIIDTVNGLDKNEINDGGLANIENGKEYYQLLLQNATASSKTVTEIQSEFEDAMDDCLKEMQSLIISNPSISSIVQNNFGSIKTNYNSYEEMMQDLATEIQEDFPDITARDYCSG